MKIMNASLIFLIMVLIMPLAGFSDWFLDVEGGWVWCGYNDVRIPAGSGTDFSLCDDLSLDSKAAFRMRLGYRFHPKHSVSVLYAPLSLNADGSVDKDIFFNGETFRAGTQLDALYRFNSYRLTYRFDFVNSRKWRVGLGITAKIRDAEIKVEDGEKSSSKKDVGLVPLLNFRVEWLFSRKLSLLLEGDALASPGGQGRAEDVLFAFRFHPTEAISLRFGYRILEGGANVESVYNFALLHYLVAGARISF
ncbi:MAG: hypothetical protein JXB23_07435 [Candidatus Aminicenantes bacterium]|nr:hypothetical protein [Candidatus Aminicenantes bacterium]